MWSKDNVHMSDASLLMTVESLIAIAMGPPEGNRIDFKMLETVLTILAKQTRILEKKVTVTIEDYQNWKGMVGARLSDSDKSAESLNGKSKETRFHESPNESDERFPRSQNDVYKRSEHLSRAKSTDDYSRSKYGDEYARSGTSGKSGDHGKLGIGRKSSVKNRSSLSAGGTPKGRFEREDSEERTYGRRKSKISGRDDDDIKHKKSFSKSGGYYDEDEGEYSNIKRGGQSDDRRGGRSDERGGGYSDDRRGGHPDDRRGGHSDERGGGYSDDRRGGYTDEKKGEYSDRGKVGRSDWNSDKTSGKGKAYEGSETGGSRTYSVSDGRSRKSQRIDSIEVVTHSEFDLLWDTVERLKQKTGPIPLPLMPTNDVLMKDIRKGKASLGDTMGAMNLNSRLEASEEMVLRMANILNSLAASGALPSNVMGLVAEANAEARIIGVAAKTAAKGRPSQMPSKKTASEDGVSKQQLHDAVFRVKNNLMDILNRAVNQTLSGAESVETSAKEINEKLTQVMRMDVNMRKLGLLVTDNVEYLIKTETGITSEVKNCQDDIYHLTSDLKRALTEFRSSTVNPETLAVNALTEKYNTLVNDLEAMTYVHALEAKKNSDLNMELTHLKTAISILQDAKAERDEVLDMFKDKADKSLLEAMFTQKEFQIARSELDEKLNKCFEKVKKHDAIWQEAFKDIKKELERKVYFVHLLAQKEELTELLQDLEKKLYCMTKMIGEPTAAMVTRQMSKNAYCGVCQGPAKMELFEKTYGMPHQLPLQRPQVVGDEVEEDECLKMEIPFPPDYRSHYCNRWSGGSNTLLGAGAVTREQAYRREKPEDYYRHYDARGTDGQMYKLSAECAPCIECNESGAGDANQAPSGASENRDKPKCTPKH